MSSRKVVALIVCLVIAFAFAGCSSDSKSDEIGIRGQISKITLGSDGKVASILVEGKKEEDTAYDKASVRINEDTEIVSADSEKKLSLKELKEGMKVEVVFKGPVAESYPVQASAKSVKILD